jgi:hypothetical protein
VRVNPNYIQAYRSMAGQIQNIPMRSNRSHTAPEPPSAGRKPVSIRGSEFAAYLSKAERKFIVETFADPRSSAVSEAGTSPDRSRGLYLDVKA